jgi:pimeloyl-ACP methyl ester carboxylesterase/DNA-binding CsgD family transcriptional regulator
MEQRIGSTRLADGTEVAYATAGAGPPLLYIGGWLSHLEASWALPAEREMFEALASGRELIRYDRPGCGLSERGDADDFSMDREVEALDAVLTATCSGPVDLMGCSLGAPVAAAWTARHPEHVRRLVLYGGWARGRDIGQIDVQEHVAAIINAHWGLGSEVLADIFAPEANASTRAAFAAYQRRSSSAHTAAELLRLCYRIDVTDVLGDVAAPTLVVHRKDDRAAPLEQGRHLAACIPQAQLEIVPGSSHLPYTGDVSSLVTSVRRFLGLPASSTAAAPELTPRQREVAALVSLGLTNREIGERLGIDERSAEGHVERIRLRLGVRSRAQVAAWWTAQRE